MAKKNPPTVRMRRLGAQLRKIRDERGLTLDDAADLLKLSKSALNRMENAQVVVRPFEVRYLLLVYGVTDKDLHDSLMGLAAAGRSKEWIKRHGTLEPRGSMSRDLVPLEQDSSAVRIYHPFAIPGLLQTPATARVILGAVRSSLSRDLDRSVSYRMARQEVLSRPNPIRLEVVIGEAALHQKVGGVEVLREQLQHLLEESQRANVTVRVLPFEVTQHPGVDGAFTMLDVETGDFTVVIIESLVRSIYVEDDDDVERYNVIFKELCAAALSEADSRVLIKRILCELDEGAG